MKLMPILFLVFIQSIYCAFAQNTVSIEIYAPKLKNGQKIKVFENNPFIRMLGNPYELEIRDGKAVKQLETGKGDLFTFRLNEQRRGIFLEPGTLSINITDTVLANATVTGSKSDQEMSEWLTDLEKLPIRGQLRMVQNIWLKKNTRETRATYDSVKLSYDQQKADYDLSRIRMHPDSYINSTLLSYSMKSMPEKQVVDLYGKLSKGTQSNWKGRFIKYNIDSLFINSVAPGFMQADTSGKMVKLSDFRGKYVLLDFWASWCIPCRAENPNLLRAYEQFKERNFSVLAVSVDSERDLWVDAIKKDKLPWTHVSELTGWNNRVSLKYQIKAVPGNFLISPEGKIVARNLRGEQLMETLEKVLPAH